MNFRNNWVWLLLATILLTFTFLHQQFGSKVKPGPSAVLPKLRAATITSVVVRPKGQREIRALRTSSEWTLTQPITYPAQSPSIEQLISFLQRLVPAASILPAELKDRPSADEDYGFTDPQWTITLSQSNVALPKILIGKTTPPGDQVYLQVLGFETVHIVTAELLKYIPHALNDWRNTSLLRLKDLAFDDVSVNNVGRNFELKKDPVTSSWRLVNPIPAPADNARLQELFQRLDSLQVSGFIADDPPDLEAFGLQPPQFELGFKQGTNTIALLQFGKSPTNDATQIFARRFGQSAVVTVSSELLGPWRAPVNDFRDPHLFTANRPINAIEIEADEKFSIQRQTNGTWRVLPLNFPADAGLVNDLLTTLSGMQIIEFTKDVVTPIDLASYGLAATSRKYVLLNSTQTNTPAANNSIVELAFGTNQNGRVYVRREGESSVYAVSSNDCAQLPTRAFQLHDRQIWDTSEEDISSVTIRQQGKQRQLLRKGRHDWSLAPGSPGIINDLAIEESVRPFCHLAAQNWVARGEAALSAFGFSQDSLQITVDLKTGHKLDLRFGNSTASNSVYAVATIDGEPWVFEFPPGLWRFVSTYLNIPANLL